MKSPANLGLGKKPKIYLFLDSQSLNSMQNISLQKATEIKPMKSSTKKIIVIGIIVLFIVSIVAGVLGGHL